MTIKKALNVAILIFLLSLPFVQSSSSSRLYRTSAVESSLIATNIEDSRFGNDGGSVGMVEDSAREVPTGPDPLHHNKHPIDP